MSAFIPLENFAPPNMPVPKISLPVEDPAPAVDDINSPVFIWDQGACSRPPLVNIHIPEFPKPNICDHNRTGYGSTITPLATSQGVCMPEVSPTTLSPSPSPSDNLCSSSTSETTSQLSGIRGPAKHTIATDKTGDVPAHGKHSSKQEGHSGSSFCCCIIM